MGVVLDSTVFMSAERAGQDARSIVINVRRASGERDFVASVVTLSELAFGLVRADTVLRRQRRQQFIDDVEKTFKVASINSSIAKRAGLLRASLQQSGQATDLADVLIAATALELGFGVATSNLRHFRRVPGLRVVEV